MQPNATEFTWDTRRRKAAILVAEDDLSDQQIADEVGVHKVTLERWKQHPDFTMRVAEHVKRLEAETLKFAISKRRKRVGALSERWAKMHQVIDERAVDPVMQSIAGGKTGLLVHRERAIGTGRNQQIIHEYEVDTGLLKELREHEKQAAQELGQWTDKGEIVIDDAGITDAERAARIAALLDRARTRRVGPAPLDDE